MSLIIITGSVGTGKTTMAVKLAKKLGFERIDISRLIKNEKIYDDYDRKQKSFVVDTKKLNKKLINLIRSSNKGLIIDSHLSHHLPKKYVDLCIVTKCGLKTLEKRLKKRGYKKQKIRENLDCEIFDVCLNEAKGKGHNIKIIDTTAGIDIAKIKI